MERRRHVALVESFHGGSHAAFATGWAQHSRHRLSLIDLPARHWKWRLRLAAWELGRRLAKLRPRPDLVVCTSLIDLAHLRCAAGPALAGVAWLVYWHENQFAYPRPPGKPLDRGFAVAHLATLNASDRHAFNSRAHRRAFGQALATFRDDIPSGVGPVRWRAWQRASRVLPPGVDFAGFPAPAPRAAGNPPRLLWNHRWEADKRPAAFARIVRTLADKGVPFRLVLLGPVDQVQPKPLLELREAVGERIERDGMARTRAEYIDWLIRSDLAVIVAAQENFGYSAVEAMAAGVVPLMPRRLSYPELVPTPLANELLYDTDRELLARLRRWLAQPAQFEALRPSVMRAARRHAWARRVRSLDDWVDACCASRRGAKQ